ncbi:hypothetical protein [Malonomonas rubra]|uniref:hypothetical protein n=1 Tax=Malonomonas rubra TaxID=57040 RepID=UPI0026F11649|nr:hypothetical protein [Malonomonas rubra]
MSERTNITNFLLLSILTAILLVSGSLQCAFDCLTRVDVLQPVASFNVQKDRVNTCHPSLNHSSSTVNCLNKACHQRLPHHRNLGGPEFYRLAKLPQPLYNGSRQPEPQYRAGSAIELQRIARHTAARLQATVSTRPPQIQYCIRATVLLC